MMEQRWSFWGSRFARNRSNLANPTLIICLICEISARRALLIIVTLLAFRRVKPIAAMRNRIIRTLRRYISFISNY